MLCRLVSTPCAAESPGEHERCPFSMRRRCSRKEIAEPKQITGNATPRPPELSASHDDISGWVQRQMPEPQPIVARMDEVICTAIPELHYAIKCMRPYYCLSQLRWIIELAAYDVSVNVVFFGCALLIPHRLRPRDDLARWRRPGVNRSSRSASRAGSRQQPARRAGDEGRSVHHAVPVSALSARRRSRQCSQAAAP